MSYETITGIMAADELFLLTNERVDEEPTQLCLACGTPMVHFCQACIEDSMKWSESQAGKTDFGPYDSSCGPDHIGCEHDPFGTPEGEPIKLSVDISWPSIGGLNVP